MTNRKLVMFRRTQYSRKHSNRILRKKQRKKGGEKRRGKKKKRESVIYIIQVKIEKKLEMRERKMYMSDETKRDVD